jgi:hypothetical protein
LGQDKLLLCRWFQLELNDNKVTTPVALHSALSEIYRLTVSITGLLTIFEKCHREKLVAQHPANRRSYAAYLVQETVTKQTTWKFC